MDVEWLQARKRELKKTDADLAPAMGVERSVANKIANGKVNLDARRADAVARILKVSRDEVLYRFGISTEPPVSDHPPTRLSSANDGGIKLQKLDLSVSMGPGTIIEDHVEADEITFDPAFVRAITRAPFARLKLITGIGDSMYPTLSWGDTIMIDTSDRALAKQDGIYWISVHGASGLKRLRTVAKDRVLIISDNPVVGDQEVGAEDLRIEGRAVWVARGL